MKLLEIYNQLLESVNYGFFADRTTIPIYDAILFGKYDQVPSKYSDWVGEIKFMTKEEYIEECAKLQRTNYADQFRMISDDNVKDIEDGMRKGIKYYMPYLNYVDRAQEGRHRVIAASNLGQKKMPVLILTRDEDKGITDISNMVGKWKDLVENSGKYYLEIPDNGDWKSISRVLSCIVKNFDYYYLDHLFDIKFGRGYDSIEDFIFKMIKNGDNGPLSYLGAEVNWDYDYEVNPLVLRWAVVLRAMRNNFSVIEDAVWKRFDEYYLKLLDGIGDNYEDYSSCEEMLLSVRSQKYIEEYNLISVDERSKLFKVDEEDVKVIMEIFNKANKKI